MAKQQAGGPAPAPVVEPMKPWRVRLVYGVVGAVVLGHLYDIARQQEHWPFSNYPMWARPAKDWHIRNVVPVGLTVAQSPGEVELTDPAYFAPLPPHYQRIAVMRVARRESKRDAMLRDYLDYYEKRRATGKHNGPRLQGVRLYEYHWDLHRDARNTEKPDHWTLIYEYVRGPGGPTSAPSTAPTTMRADQ
jgi:hypothetical protein